MDICRKFHPITMEYAFYSSTYETSFRTNYMLGYKTNDNKFKRKKIVESVLSNHNNMKLESNSREKKLRNSQICEN